MASEHIQNFFNDRVEQLQRLRDDFERRKDGMDDGLRQHHETHLQEKARELETIAQSNGLPFTPVG
jgi:hypothetical protein